MWILALLTNILIISSINSSRILSILLPYIYFIMKKIIIVRHGQTNANVDGITQGQIDSELNELGISQA